MTKDNGESGDKNNRLANFCSFQHLMQSYRIISHLLLQQRIEEPAKVLKQLKFARRPRNITLVLDSHRGQKNFFLTSCGSLIPFTRANAQWVFHGFHIAL